MFRSPKDEYQPKISLVMASGMENALCMGKIFEDQSWQALKLFVMTGLQEILNSNMPVEMTLCLHGNFII